MIKEMVKAILWERNEKNYKSFEEFSLAFEEAYKKVEESTEKIPVFGKMIKSS